jgi:hypothetical protein
MSSASSPQLVEWPNLSLAWADVVDRLSRPGVSAISPLALSITGFNEQGVPAEVPAIREAADALLAEEGKKNIENVAFTIFPQKYWEMCDGDSDALFAMYIDAFQRIKEFNPRNNARGSYFQRLVDFDNTGKGWNQLKWILSEYRRNPSARKSKWQATTFDPARDHSSTAQLEFPCLQQVSFTFAGNDGLILNAFYATQQLCHKGYGNYLGLSRLGAFMASQMERRLERVNVFVGIAKMDKIKKTDPNFTTLLGVIRSELEAASKASEAA